MKIINPANGKLVREVSDLKPEEIHSIYEKLRKGQPAWAAVPLEERINRIAHFNQLLLDHIDSLAESLTLDMGKPFSQAKGEIRGASKRVNFFIDKSEEWLKDEVAYEDDGVTERISYEPLGVIGNISAWNYPYLVGVNVFIPALIAGNAVMYKPSEFATLTGIGIERLLRTAGIPNTAFALICGGGEAGKTLLELPLDAYFFTGSNKTGTYIYQQVAKKMVPCQLELGGKDPLYISADNTNSEALAEAAAEGAFYNNGQSCCAVERIYVHENLYEEFLGNFVKAVSAYKVGGPMEEGVFIGPLSRKEQVKVLEEQVADALSKGARLLTGGKAIEGEGFYFEPTVLADVDHSMQVMKDESFGPIIGIQSVTGDEEAIRLMQDTEYGLTAAVYSDHYNTAEPILKKMNTGTAYWNCCDRVSPFLPWSGRKGSGIGMTLSYQGIRAFVKPKAYHIRKS